jgi:hypothetical protein
VDEPDLYEVFVRPLHSTGVRYMIVGSVASVHYGEPRFTMDVDLVVQLAEAEISRLAVAFPEADYYVPPPEIIEEEMRRSTRGHFNIIHHATGFKADFYPWRRDEEWGWVWERCRNDEVNGHTASFAPPEYVIVSKLDFYREGGSEKHLRDIRSMLAISGDQIDRALIENAVAKLGLGEQWRKATAD